MGRLERADGPAGDAARGRRTRRRLVVASLAASALLVGCSSAATTGIPTAAQKARVERQSGGALTRARMRSALLKRSDIPAGWQSKRHDTQGGDMPRALQRRLASCLGVRHAVTHPLSGVESPNFVRGHAQVSSSVERYRRHTQVARDVKLMRNRKAPRCLGEVFRSYLPTVLPPEADVTNLVVHIARAQYGAPKDVVGVLTVSFGIAAGGRQIDSQIAETMIAKGTVEAEVDSVVLGGRVERSMQHRLGNLVGRRVERL